MSCPHCYSWTPFCIRHATIREIQTLNSDPSWTASASHQDNGDYYRSPAYASGFASSSSLSGSSKASLTLNRSPLSLWSNTPNSGAGSSDKTIRRPAFRFLELPLELRQHIYSLVLPRTEQVNSPVHQKEIIWRRGSTALMLASRQLYEECVQIMYGKSVFVIDVNYDSIIFHFKHRLPSGLCPQLKPPFLEFLSENCIKQIRHVVVTVDYVDAYTGMIKFNCAGAGLASGLQAQVRRLTEALGRATELRTLVINLIDWNRDLEAAQNVLRPLGDLKNVTQAVEIRGPVKRSFVLEMQDNLLRGCKSHDRTT